MQVEGGQGGGGKRRQMQAHGVGIIDMQQRLSGGGCGKIPGGRRTIPVEDVGGGCYRKRGGKMTTE